MTQASKAINGQQKLAKVGQSECQNTTSHGDRVHSYNTYI